MKGALIERRGEMEAVCVSGTTTKKIGISTLRPDPRSENPRDFKLGELDGMVRKGRVLEYFDLADGRIPEGVFSKITYCSQVQRQPRQPTTESPANGRQDGGINGAEESGGILSESEKNPPGSDVAEATDQGEMDEERQVQEVEIDDVDIVPASPQSLNAEILHVASHAGDDGSSSSEDEGGNRAPVGEVRQGKGGRQDKGAKRKKGPIEMDDEAREAVRGFKKGSTQVPASAEDVASRAFKQACLSEWANNIVGNDVLGKEVMRQQVKAVVKMGWRLTWKEQEGKPRKPKARFFGKGFTDHRKVDTYVGTPSLWVICTMILFCVSQGYKIDAADVTAAFLTSRDHNVERIGALIPESIPDLPAE
uniref:Reverse transcriptase Ty1/copia-type domain-containing protein n=1 Tax=Chromera velia CCMP2878 TaxID=1169474 RepID=A0A0G4FJJ7_9ALVE|eukprot:Cvel_3396.t1-p1 / transcript=Cvel_3396.t1 / gene=Cvel_3396 / organism=Chromera_velia_CCMP2878 / gene_product=hypothetical protein / transcript_product=hypothetical protein / location=Cvel_scaffold137:5671-7083(-) / protein_length=364 / sequence_SO=supercontig / SO=protein_coding / is_pseudo=false